MTTAGAPSESRPPPVLASTGPAPPPPLMPAGPSGRPLVMLVGGVLSASAILFGMLQVVALLGHGEVTDEWSYPPGIERVVVDVESGGVEVLGQARDGVHVTRRLSLSIERPDVTERVEGSTLRITGDCDLGFMPWCGSSYSLEVPRSVAVEVVSRSGDIVVEGVDGGVRAESSAGDLAVADVSGSLRLRSAAGDIEGSHLRSATVTAETSAGMVDLGFSVEPRTVTASSAAGDVRIGVPPGEAAYRVEGSSSGADVDTAVATSPTSNRVIDASSSAGAVSVRYA